MAEVLTADLTALHPQVMDGSGRTKSIWPVFCLPWFLGEPPLVGEAAKKHRRAADPYGAAGEARLDLENRARYHLAEGWLAMTQRPDDLQPANAIFSWKPPDEKHLVTLNFASVIAACLEPWWHRDSTLVLIVPDALGPGPREEILQAVGTKFGRAYCLPRTVAAALAWCQREPARQLAQESGIEPGEHVGCLLVTTMAADTGECALIPLRLELNGEERILCPVHARSRHGAELGEIGLLWATAAADKAANFSAEDCWKEWLVNYPEREEAPVPATPGLKAKAAFDAYSYRSGHAERKPNGSWKEVLAQTQIEKKSEQILAWLQVGDSKALLSAPGGNRLGAPLIFDTQQLSSADVLSAGMTLVEKLNKGQVPFFEALASVDLFVIAKNAYRDPIKKWRPLIEATEVPFGFEYRSPSPITDIALPAGRVRSIGLYARSERRGAFSYRYVTASQEEPQENQEPVKVVARLRPGQGLASFEIHSMREGGFSFSASERHMAPIDEKDLPTIKYAWPMGSAWIVSHPPFVAEYDRAFALALARLRASKDMEEILKGVRDTTNKWPRPIDCEIDPESLDFPRELIDPAFVYLGVFPSGEENSPPAILKRTQEYGEFLNRAYSSTSALAIQKKVLYSASWLYHRCPELLLNAVRSALVIPDYIDDAVLACAGNCFSTTKDYRIFFASLTTFIQKQYGLADVYWIRALRNLTRFRAEALELQSVTRKDWSTIMNWYIRIFESALKNPGGNEFLHCTYLAPQLLKRRRFDVGFLEIDSPGYKIMEETLVRAKGRAKSQKHKTNLKVALEFLQKTAKVPGVPET